MGTSRGMPPSHRRNTPCTLPCRACGGGRCACAKRARLLQAGAAAGAMHAPCPAPRRATTPTPRKHACPMHIIAYLYVPLSPYRNCSTAAGRMAAVRVASRRCQVPMRTSRNPRSTTCAEGPPPTHARVRAASDNRVRGRAERACGARARPQHPRKHTPTTQELTWSPGRLWQQHCAIRTRPCAADARAPGQRWCL